MSCQNNTLSLLIDTFFLVVVLLNTSSKELYIYIYIKERIFLQLGSTKKKKSKKNLNLKSIGNIHYYQFSKIHCNFLCFEWFGRNGNGKRKGKRNRRLQFWSIHWKRHYVSCRRDTSGSFSEEEKKKKSPNVKIKDFFSVDIFNKTHGYISVFN